MFIIDYILEDESRGAIALDYGGWDIEDAKADASKALKKEGIVFKSWEIREIWDSII